MGQRLLGITGCYSDEPPLVVKAQDVQFQFFVVVVLGRLVHPFPSNVHGLKFFEPPEINNTQKR